MFIASGRLCFCFSLGSLQTPLVHLDEPVDLMRCSKLCDIKVEGYWCVCATLRTADTSSDAP